jgi:hypothetical protein
MAPCEVLGDERKETACGFLRRAVAWFAAKGLKVQRILTDGNAYRSGLHRATCAPAEHPSQPHPCLPAAHQRQGRALHPDPDRALGLRGDLRLLGRAHR